MRILFYYLKHYPKEFLFRLKMRRHAEQRKLKAFDAMIPYLQRIANGHPDPQREARIALWIAGEDE